MFNNINDQILFLIVICFSFHIFVLSIYIRNEEFLSRIMGISFFSPLFFYTAAYFIPPAQSAFSLLLFSCGEYILFIEMFLLLTIRFKRKHSSAVKLLMILVPAAVFLLLYYNNAARSFLFAPLNNTIIYISASVLVLSSLIFKHKGRILLISGVVLLVSSHLLAAYISNHSIDYFFSAMKFLGYAAFSVYFANDFLGKILSRAAEAKERLHEVSKTLNHEVKKRVMEVERVNEQLLHKSKTDHLSSSLNKAAIVEMIEEIILTKPKDGFSVVMFDIDKFKSINDTMGHIIGDKCIRKISIIARQSIRDIDVLGRYGGDEFLLIIPGTTAWQSKLIADRLRENVEKTDSPHLTISVGIASFPDDAKNAKDLIAAADEALYISKERGRNTVSHRELF